MTGLVRKAMLLSVCGLLFAGVAMASVPSAATSSVPKGLYLVSLDGGGAPDPFGTFSITVNDLAGNPIANCPVVIDMTNCGPDERVDCATGAPFTMVWPTTGGKYEIRATTNAFGVVTGAIAGGSNNAAPVSPPFSTFLSAHIYASGVDLTPSGITVACLDEDSNSAGAGGNDFSLFSNDFFSSNAAQRSDFDFDGVLGANDRSKLADAHFAGGEVSTPASLCTIP